MSVTAGALIELVAEQLDLPVATVGAYYRVLREKGLVTKGGRGRSAPNSTARDAATLLVALLCSPRGVDAGEQVVEYARLHSIRTGSDFLSAVETVLAVIALADEDGDLSYAIGCTNQVTAHVTLPGWSMSFGRSSEVLAVNDDQQLPQALPRGMVQRSQIFYPALRRIACGVLD